MKMIMAIINNSDMKEVSNHMMKGGFTITKIGSAGGFLKSGITTIISAVRDDSLQAALDIIKSSTHSQKYNSQQISSSASSYVYGVEPQEMVVGGATVFVLNIEETYKF